MRVVAVYYCTPAATQRMHAFLCCVVLSCLVSGLRYQAAETAAEGGTSSSPQPPPAPRKTSKGRLVISRQSMETAFAAVCKAYVPRPGQPMSRTREEVTALAQVSIKFLGYTPYIPGMFYFILGCTICLFSSGIKACGVRAPSFFFFVR